MKKLQPHTHFLQYVTAAKKINSYLEIGICFPDHNFDYIPATFKIGVDPDPHAAAQFNMTSDDFFSSLDLIDSINGTITKFDLVWIDGLHESQQVCRDINNVLRHLAPNGIIGLHDMNPPTETIACYPRGKQREWCGSTFLAGVAARKNAYLDIVTIDADYGCMFIKSLWDDWSEVKGDAIVAPSEISWQEFDANRKELLNLVSIEEFKEWL